MKIVIVNYGLGNLGSVKNMLKKVGFADSLISDEPKDILDADKLILPGVGSFDYGMQQLKRKELDIALNEAVLNDKKPILGICLGAQLMCNLSEEGKEKGLGWIDAVVQKFIPSKDNIKVPHMGWNHVKEQKTHPILNNLEQPSRFYFVHSYFMRANREEDILLTTDYDGTFASALQSNNCVATQFHPEKSHKFGMQIFKNFIHEF